MESQFAINIDRRIVVLIRDLSFDKSGEVVVDYLASYTGTEGGLVKRGSDDDLLVQERINLFLTQELNE